MYIEVGHLCLMIDNSSFFFLFSYQVMISLPIHHPMPRSNMCIAITKSNELAIKQDSENLFCKAKTREYLHSNECVHCMIKFPMPQLMSNNSYNFFIIFALKGKNKNNKIK
jgi:hypothetical protein